MKQFGSFKSAQSWGTQTSKANAEPDRHSALALNISFYVFLHFCLYLVYFCSLAWIYIEFIYYYYRSVGLALEIEFSRLVEALVAIAICTVFQPIKFNKFSDLLYCVVMIFTIIPTAMMFCFAGTNRDVFYC